MTLGCSESNIHIYANLLEAVTNYSTAGNLELMQYLRDTAKALCGIAHFEKTTIWLTQTTCRGLHLNEYGMGRRMSGEERAMKAGGEWRCRFRSLPC